MESDKVLKIPTDQLDCADQARKIFDAAPLDALVDSVQQFGILQPLRVRRRGARYFVLDGERRLRAAKLAGLKTVPAILEDRDLSDGDVLVTQVVMNCLREDLKALEQARGISDLISVHGMTAAEVAKRLSFSEAKISRLTSLLTLPPSVQAKIESGELAPSTAAEIARTGDRVEQERLAEEAAAGGLTRDAVAGRRKAAARPEDGAQPRRSPVRVMAALDSRRSVTLAGPALDSLDTVVAWLEELLAKARKARTQGVGLKTFTDLLRDQAKATG